MPVAPWITIEQAEEQGLRMPEWLKREIGPRREGIVWRSGYWKDINYVIKVEVRVDRVLSRGVEVTQGGAFRITERSSDEERIRTHMTGWEHDRLHGKDQLLYGPADLRTKEQRIAAGVVLPHIAL